MNFTPHCRRTCQRQFYCWRNFFRHVVLAIFSRLIKEFSSFFLFFPAAVWVIRSIHLQTQMRYSIRIESHFERNLNVSFTRFFSLFFFIFLFCAAKIFTIFRQDMLFLGTIFVMYSCSHFYIISYFISDSPKALSVNFFW